MLTPSGQWICNDDFNGHNPYIEFSSPESGYYEIWVGTYADSTVYPAELVITEGDPQW